MKQLIDRLEQEQTPPREDWIRLLEDFTPEDTAYLCERARHVRQMHYQNRIFIRGLIEFTNYCKNDCFYCGIRRSNCNTHRYRLSKATILDCCRRGYELGFRTFVLQGGEDGHFTDAVLTDIVHAIRTEFPDCAITLSIGERSRDSYQQLFDAGANRFLLRHETFDSTHYASLHPAGLTAASRQKCLWDLKEIGYQVGSGIMVGSPKQTAEHLAEDLLFLKELNPHMIGIGPFIPQKDTPFREERAGTLELTLFLLGLLRLMLPKVLLPSTTALSTIHPDGRKMGVLAGANVVMPNLSPTEVRKDYLLYDNKICTGDESAQCRHCLERRMASVGYQVVTSRGDSLNI